MLASHTSYTLVIDSIMYIHAQVNYIFFMYFVAESNLLKLRSPIAHIIEMTYVPVRLKLNSICKEHNIDILMMLLVSINRIVNYMFIVSKQSLV